ncbi:hypothetical protein C5167_042512 [Papaver somniferum]|uniref:Uncharacterized protein n=1 Tax=Papaver somniferum TaxID=3469 RepID=A0A4Y7L427_PAPSO|nr:hypothetical protein C5167_042512 [Papaver somniferum]
MDLPRPKVLMITKFAVCFPSLSLKLELQNHRVLASNYMGYLGVIKAIDFWPFSWVDDYKQMVHLWDRPSLVPLTGSYLDPLADKVLIGSVAVAMVKMDLISSWLVGLVVLRDVGTALQRTSTLGKLVGVYQPRRSSSTKGGTPLSEQAQLLNTVFQLTEVYIKYTSLLVASTTAASTVAYGARYLRICGFWS